ncbi:hypothetical protein H4217_004895 [Coemansia sp. RSA 1939]|nr:hypothetical protein H4217_004895 [Coemansia sp. RSA 1939]
MGTISEVFGDTNSEPPTAWVNACTSSGVALPPLTMNYFDSVRKSTADFTNSAGNALVAIDINSAKKHAHSIMACDKFEKYTRKADGWSRNLPLVFDNISQEINLITVIDLLQIGSGFRRELYEETGRGASETIYFGL